MNSLIITVLLGLALWCAYKIGALHGFRRGVDHNILGAAAPKSVIAKGQVDMLLGSAPGRMNVELVDESASGIWTAPGYALHVRDFLKLGWPRRLRLTIGGLAGGCLVCDHRAALHAHDSAGREWCSFKECRCIGYLAPPDWPAPAPSEYRTSFALWCGCGKYMLAAPGRAMVCPDPNCSVRKVFVRDVPSEKDLPPAASSASAVGGPFRDYSHIVCSSCDHSAYWHLRQAGDSDPRFACQSPECLCGDFVQGPLRK